MLENLGKGEFEYQRLSQEEQSKRGILGRLVGVMADFTDPTRNGRFYSEELWDKVFDDPIMQEKLDNRQVLGELGHPADRLETDLEKVAICLAEKPKKKDGKLYGVFDILSTPNGKILKTLCDYGCTMAISSRGEGDIISDYSGNESVDPNTFQCETWDIVQVPGVKCARLNLVTEGLNTKVSLNEALQKKIDEASDDDKKIMKETLENLNIDYISSEIEDVNKKTDIAANNAGATMVKQLQEALLVNRKNEAKITELQEKLSVCYTKEAKYEEELSRYKNTTKVLSSSTKNAKQLQSELERIKEELEIATSKNKRLQEKIEHISKSRTDLRESITSKETDLNKLGQNVQTLNEQLTSEREKHVKEMKSLKEEYVVKNTLLQEKLADTEKNLSIKAKEYNMKLERSNNLVEKFRDIAKKAILKYVESKALGLGISKDKILENLPKNYSFMDIDEVCEKLSSYNKVVSKLPFTIDTFETSSKVSIKESKDSYLEQENPDDDVDDSLLKLLD